MPKLFLSLLLLINFSAASQSLDIEMLTLDAGSGSAQPRLANNPSGPAVLSWLTTSSNGAQLRYASLEDDAWSPPRLVSKGDDWFINWADFPSVQPITSTLWAAHWLVKRAGGTYAYDVAIALSSDGGITWGQPITPHTDNTATEHGFVSLFPWQGQVGAIWLDGRNTHGGHGHEHSAGGAMTLRAARLLREGQATISTAAEELDDRVCDCCPTQVAQGPDGPIAVYRNRSAGEIRDIYVARSLNGQWQPGKAVANEGWKIAGCPVNGPSIASHGRKVAVGWFSAKNDIARVRVATSIDGGSTFGAPLDLAGDNPVGRVGIAVLANGDTWVSWLRPGDNGELVLRGISPDGALSETLVVAQASIKRISGIPQLLAQGRHLIMAWTSANLTNSEETGSEDNSTTVASARITPPPVR